MPPPTPLHGSGSLHFGGCPRRPAPTNHHKTNEKLTFSLLASLGLLLGALGPLLATLGPLLGRSWAALGRSGSALGRSWGALGELLGALGRSWADSQDSSKNRRQK